MEAPEPLCDCLHQVVIKGPSDPTRTTSTSTTFERERPGS